MKARLLLPTLAALSAAISAAHAANFNISTASTTAQTLSSGQTGTITSTGSLTVSGSTVAVTIDGSSTLTNSGQLKQTGSGRAIRDNKGGLTLTVTNNAGALMQTADADVIQMNKASSNITFYNYGSVISLNASAGGSQSIDFGAITSGTNSLYNYATGIIQTTAADAVRPGANGYVENAGTIEAIPIVEGSSPNRDASGSDGIDFQSNSGGQVVNSGSISGRHGITGGETASGFTVSVTNNLGGTITGKNSSGINIDGATASPGSATVTNRGTITGNFDNTKYDIGDGDGVDVDGTVNISNYGNIIGNGASVGNNSEGVSIGGGTITNYAGASIYGQNNTGTASAGNGILVDDSNGGAAHAATTVTNSGTIRGYSGFGIKMIGSYDDTITNNAGGTIRGAGTGAAIQTGDGSDTVTNAGAIIGDNGSAIDLEGGNDSLKIQGGSASITGNVSGGTGANTVEIDLGSGNSFAYAGSLSNFSTVQVKTGTTTLTGTNAYTGTTQVTGGTLVLDGDGRLSDSSTLNLNGGRLELSDDSTQTFASLSLTANSVIDLNSDTALTLSALGTINGASTLSVINNGGSSFRFLGDLTSDVNFQTLLGNTTVNGGAATASYDGTYTNVVPEPGTVGLIGLGIAFAIGMARRRRKSS